MLAQVSENSNSLRFDSTACASPPSLFIFSLRWLLWKMRVTIFLTILQQEVLHSRQQSYICFILAIIALDAWDSVFLIFGHFYQWILKSIKILVTYTFTGGLCSQRSSMFWQDNYKKCWEVKGSSQNIHLSPLKCIILTEDYWWVNFRAGLSSSLKACFSGKAVFWQFKGKWVS